MSFSFQNQIKPVLNDLNALYIFCQNTQFKDKKTNQILQRYLTVSKLKQKISNVEKALEYANNNDDKIFSIL